MNQLKRGILFLQLTLLIFSIGSIELLETKASYNYDYWQQSIPAIDGYSVLEDGIISGTNIDATLDSDEEDVYVKDMEDLFITNDYYYIVDKEIARIIITDKDFNTIHVISSFSWMEDDIEVTYTLQDPRGIFVSEDNELYITDFEGKAIYVLDANFDLINKITAPDNPTYGDREFKVEKIVLDRTKRIYVTVGNIYDGIIELTGDGIFSRFVGVQQVQVNPIDLIWRRLMTQEQLSKTVLFLPVEYTNMAIDQEGFIFATATSDSNTPIQRLNPKGSDVLVKNGYVPPVGDIIRYIGQDESNFVSIDVNSYGMYSVLDRANKKIFTYNSEGYLIYITGQAGEFAGTFKYPTALAYDDEKILVSDSELNTITVFTPTDFGEKVNHVLELTYQGQYLNVAPLWEEVIEENSNFSYAYVGIGDALFREKRYEESMESYRLGFDKEGYSKAYEQHRKDVLRDNFPLVGLALGAIVFFTIIRPIIVDLRNKR